MAHYQEYQDMWDSPLDMVNLDNIDPRLLGGQHGLQQGTTPPQSDTGFPFIGTRTQEHSQNVEWKRDLQQRTTSEDEETHMGEVLQAPDIGPHGGHRDILGNPTIGYEQQPQYLTPETDPPYGNTPPAQPIWQDTGNGERYIMAPGGPVDRTVSQPVRRGSQTPAVYPPRLVPLGPEAVQEEVIGQGRRPSTTGTAHTANSPRSQQPQRKRDLSYAIEVVPANFEDPDVSANQLEIHERLAAKGLDGYLLRWVPSTHFGNQFVRRFVFPRRLLHDDRTRLLFMQVFNSNRSYNSKLAGYEFKMVQVFEPQQFHASSDDYDIAGLAAEVGDGLGRFGDHGIADLAAYTPPSPEPHHDLDLPSLTAAMPEQPAALPTPKDDNDIHAAQRSKPIPKPERDVRKNANGKYECTFDGCTEEQREFNRKCEWNKHMDKHERPYKCLAEGCEKLAGFTYSGGLLRHEREVHSKHGGPRNPLNCPHVNCKRHSGKGFSRLENLNEHLRRVHTNPVPGASGDEAAEDGDSVAASEAGQVLQGQLQFQPQQQQAQIQHSPQLVAIVPQKRPHEDDGTDLPSEVKRLRQSEEDLFRTNAELIRQLAAQKAQAEIEAASQKQELEAQKRQIMAMMAQMENMQRQIDEQQSQDPVILDFP